MRLELRKQTDRRCGNTPKPRQSGVRHWAELLFFASIALLCQACSDRQGQNMAPGNESSMLRDELDSAKRYVNVTAYQYRTDDDGVRTEIPRMLKAEGAIAKMSSFFKDLDRGKESPTAAAWEPDARIEFARKDATVLAVYLDSELEYWTEGAGDWELPANFAPYFKSLFAAPSEAGAKICCGVREVVRAVIRSYYKADRTPGSTSIEIADAAVAKRIASFFPGMDQGKEGHDPAAEDAFAEIAFVRSDGSRNAVRVSFSLDSWSEGKGDWPLSRAFEAYFLNLLQRSEGGARQADE